MSEPGKESWPHRLVVVEGPIGVGKTTLASKIAARIGAETVFEQADENPFIERFYKDPRGAAFPTQLFFLFQRARQLQELRQQDLFAPLRVGDYLLDKDRLFARINLDDDEYSLYEQVYARLSIDMPRPDLVIFLQAPVEVLLERIVRRGRSYEKNMEPGYLARLVEAYTRYFHQYTESPLLIVNSTVIDPVADSRDFEELFEAIRVTRRGRHFYNAVRE